MAERSMLFASGDDVEITYLEGEKEDQLSGTVVDERDGLLRVLWGYDTIVFNMRSRTFVRARLLHAAPHAMAPDEARAWHLERLEAVRQAFEALDQPAARADETPVSPAWLATLRPDDVATPSPPAARTQVASAPAGSYAHGALHERWQSYLQAARAELGLQVPFARLARRAALRWLRVEPPELAPIATELMRLLDDERHDSVERAFLGRAERGEIFGLRHHESGDVRFVTAEHLERLLPAERAQYEAYDPLLARALREAALSTEVEEVVEAAEG